MYFELHPDYSFMLENLETFSIRFLASMFNSMVSYTKPVKKAIVTKVFTAYVMMV